LSYPVTNHSVQAWGGNARLPNSLRFKVRATDNGRLVGVIFHAPCLPPAAFAPDRTAIIATWQRVHGLLDELTQPAAARRYAPITDADRRAALKPGLDGVSLQRIPE
jgi:CRISPR-associated protein Cmr1